jgi:RNA polymerase sigma factor (sigma-70 family)
VEASALNHVGAASLRGPTPLLRLASDERLVAITRRGNHAAFEALVARYHARLLAFCRHMLGSREDAEDVLQEVFAAAFNAMVADERAINVRPWLYRIARNRSLNHLRRAQPIGVDSMDVHVAEHGATTAEKVHRREEFRELMADVQTLPETQRTALLLREIDALSYEQIAEAMDTTIPSVKSLLVRARVSLAEAAEARTLTCADVRDELGQVAEGLRQRLSAPGRRHVRGCDRCSSFRKQLRATNKALAAVFPVGPLLFFKKALLAHLGTTASAGGAAATTAVAGGTAAGSASMISAGVSAVATKTAAGLAAAALVTAGAVEVNHAQSGRRHQPRPLVAAAPRILPAPPVEPSVVAVRPQPTSMPAKPAKEAKAAAAVDKARANADQAAAATTTTPASGGAVASTTTTPGLAVQQQSDTTTLPPQDAAQTGGTPAPAEPAPAPGQPPTGQPQPTTTPAEPPQPSASEPPPSQPAPSQPAPSQQPAPSEPRSAPEGPASALPSPPAVTAPAPAVQPPAVQPVADPAPLAG